jgi:hypothetical protein
MARFAVDVRFLIEAQNEEDACRIAGYASTRLPREIKTSEDGPEGTLLKTQLFSCWPTTQPILEAVDATD